MNSNTKDKLIFSLLILLLFIGIFGLSYAMYRKYIKQEIVEVNKECISETLTETMQDNFMSGVIEENAKYKVIFNYYQCNPILRNDIVLFKFSERIPAVPRRVVGLPRDKFDIIKNDSGHWDIKINDILMTLNGKSLFIKSNSIPPLKVYQQSLKGILPKGKYILLSNNSPGMSDSRNLGLIEKKSITGKVQLLHEDE